MTFSCQILPMGDSAMVIRFEECIDPAVNDMVMQVSAAVVNAALPGVRDVVPAIHTVTVHYDPLRTDERQLGVLLERASRATRAVPQPRRAALEIPVCYGGDFGPDLAGLAEWATLGEQDVVRLHTSVTYRVYMLGFMPGFAYLGTVDTRIAMPRRATPRMRVPRGSVAIAGPQTGVYPDELPGGWQIIGRTPLEMFNASRTRPSLLSTGDCVQFKAIDPEQFDRARRVGAATA